LGQTIFIICISIISLAVLYVLYMGFSFFRYKRLQAAEVMARFLIVSVVIMICLIPVLIYIFL